MPFLSPFHPLTFGKRMNRMSNWHSKGGVVSAGPTGGPFSLPILANTQTFTTQTFSQFAFVKYLIPINQESHKWLIRHGLPILKYSNLQSWWIINIQVFNNFTNFKILNKNALSVSFVLNFKYSIEPNLCSPNSQYSNLYLFFHNCHVLTCQCHKIPYRIHIYF